MARRDTGTDDPRVRVRAASIVLPSTPACLDSLDSTSSGAGPGTPTPQSEIW